MTDYDKLINKACECIAKAVDARVKGDVHMQKFWNNAYEGFKRRASKMTEAQITEEQND